VRRPEDASPRGVTSCEGLMFATPHFASSGFDIGTETLHPYGSSRFGDRILGAAEGGKREQTHVFYSSWRTLKMPTNRHFRSSIGQTVMQEGSPAVPQGGGRSTGAGAGLDLRSMVRRAHPSVMGTRSAAHLDCRRGADRPPCSCRPRPRARASQRITRAWTDHR
jgi:hypothetical protein